MMRKHMAIVALILMLTGCAAFLDTEPKEFVYSSADLNGGVMHAATVTGIPLSDLILQINDLAAKRGLVLVQKFDCSATACKLIYKSTGENKSINYASTRTTSTGHYPYSRPFDDPYYYSFPPTTTTEQTVKSVNLGYSSKYFISLTTHNNAIDIEMVGVPVLNQEMSCPEALLHAFVNCAPPVVTGEKDIPLKDSFKRVWGYDISGSVEADVITGIFAELSMIVEASANAKPNSSETAQPASPPMESASPGADTDVDTATNTGSVTH